MTSRRILRLHALFLIAFTILFFMAIPKAIAGFLIHINVGNYDRPYHVDGMGGFVGDKTLSLEPGLHIFHACSRDFALGRS